MYPAGFFFGSAEESFALASVLSFCCWFALFPPPSWARSAGLDPADATLVGFSPLAFAALADSCAGALALAGRIKNISNGKS